MKIVLTGPESVGKSTLAKQLARYYNGVFVPEYARNYIETLNHSYDFSDVEKIAREQIREYDCLHKQPGFCFFDTYLIITKVWFLHKYHRLPDWFESELEKRPVDHYLLCKDDLSWEEDSVRENKDIRGELFNKYEKELKNYGFSYSVITGEGNDRFENAIKAINLKLKDFTI